MVRCVASDVPAGASTEVDDEMFTDGLEAGCKPAAQVTPESQPDFRCRNYCDFLRSLPKHKVGLTGKVEIPGGYGYCARLSWA